GCYKFTVTDSGCDGISWWAYQYYNPNPGTGLIRFNYTGTFSTFYQVNGDFGCGMVKYFRVSNTTGLMQSVNSANTIDVFPNPASNEFHLQFDLRKQQTANCKIMDITGKTVLIKKTGKVSLGTETVDISGLPAGSYIINIELEDGSSVNKKLVIQK
ncbi:MAG: T9SS type A sorting domain-containing protein, partial [Bacteroidia bacterium]